MSYQPEPIDTSKVAVNTEHLKLTELLAKNTHEIWAQQRIAEGWKYGLQRDDNKKEHPGLVPYEELSESEKQYDRNTAIGVIKTLLALGYQILGKGKIKEEYNPVEEQELAVMLRGLKQSSEINLASLLQLQRETIKIKPRTPEIYWVLAESILGLGEPMIAYDVIATGLNNWPNDLRLNQLMALALARSGATSRANDLLLQLVTSGQTDTETISLLARTHKDLSIEATELAAKNYQLHQAAARYEQAYQLSGSYYPGINAATMAMLLGEETKAQEIATKVRSQCLQKLTTSQNDYWLLATLGEAALILRAWTEAEEWYAKAVKMAQGRFGDISSTRKNAKLLLKYLEGNSDRLKNWFWIPRVVVFSGHMIDQPGRTTPRFPPALENFVAQEIRDRLSQLDARLGYASAACGADILFLEALLELKGEIHIILPFEREKFIRESVDIIPGSNWLERFDRLCKQATEVIIASNFKLDEYNVLYDYANRLLHGLSKMKAQQLDTEMVSLAVWDGLSNSGLGGTASAINYWQKSGEKVEIIDLKSILQSFSTAPQATTQTIIQPNSSRAIQQESRHIMALLFADVVKYSKITEEQIVPFVENFLGAVAQLENNSEYQVVMKNTWGDALYYVFPNVNNAGKFALDLCSLVQKTDWSAKGLPKELNLRISLHAGPVYRYVNPLTQRVSYIGTNVTYGARIEPIAPPGQVYASQAFAALAASEGVKEFTCDYVGQRPLAKDYGTFPTYHVRRM